MSIFLTEVENNERHKCTSKIMWKPIKNNSLLWRLKKALRKRCPLKWDLKDGKDLNIQICKNGGTVFQIKCSTSQDNLELEKYSNE